MVFSDLSLLYAADFSGGHICIIYTYIHVGFFQSSTTEKRLSLIFCCSLAQSSEFNDFLKNKPNCAPSFLSWF